ncbi:hypothetical protein M2480_003049 [Parabacteroides sp. PFB2-12]|uniref:hypothetical protein n=1 Tax=unclassified Parabacteroides TaxID=2649774 RepID=UPI002475BB2E|nr:MULTISPECIES: hypothetical protein [unclassified Parabacteroides]MDH6342783.1 hypothetical protein [Parabacteroides sp. PM6-13]MDH6392043.1 hypothetical protein [Parabacteroides sp. PFB2-12]
MKMKMKTKGEDWKLQTRTKSQDLQRVDESTMSGESAREEVGLDHVERGQFIPFSHALKKLG